MGITQREQYVGIQKMRDNTRRGRQETKTRQGKTRYDNRQDYTNEKNKTGSNKTNITRGKTIKMDTRDTTTNVEILSCVVLS